jgi:diacylglycerol kinase family enzyme
MVPEVDGPRAETVLDVFVVHSKRLGENLDVLWNAMGGDASSSAQISHARVKHRVTIRPYCDASAVFDGESMRRPEYSLQVRPGDLNIVTAAPRL